MNFRHKFRSVLQQMFFSNSKMKSAYFYRQEGDERFILTFHLNHDRFNREFKFNRNFAETISATIQRIRTNFEKEFKKKNKLKKKNSESIGLLIDSLTVEVLNCGKPLSTELTWQNLFNESNINPNDLVLQVIDQQYQVKYNYPYIESIKLPKIILTGFNCYPSKCAVSFTTVDQCKFEWFKLKENSQTEWEKCGDEFFYHVKVDDLNHFLKLICTPRKGLLEGESIELISELPLIGPEFNAFKVKQKFTENRLPADGRGFRVVSYNLLADFYADSDFSRTKLFPYCPSYALAIDYRKLLFINEILSYNTDICCLQEVDEKIFDWDLKLALEAKGFKGTMQTKGDTREGVATFYHATKFELIEKYGFSLGHEIENAPYFQSLYEQIKNNVKLCERLLSLSTALQVTLLKFKYLDKYLIVANTHLYFHPDADHIRLLQIGFFMLYIEHIYNKTKQNFNLTDEQISIVFCGDFNSVPECGIYKLMTERYVPDDFIDFKSNKEQAVSGVTLQQPFNIASAYGAPQYTNFTVGFAACLDYIFYETDKLKVNQLAPLPTEDELKQFSAIPSIVFPSDHISLVADLEWK